MCSDNLSPRLYGVGIGPGDPELITLKAKRVLESADIILSPKADLKSSSIAREIAGSILPDLPFKEVVYPMTKDTGILEKFWMETAELVCGFADKGKTVAFITLGDPSFYSTWSYLYKKAAALRPDLPIEVIPGISSFQAASAALKTGLVTGDENLAIVPAPEDPRTLEPLLALFDSIILLKAGQRFNEIMMFLKDKGLEDNVYLAKKMGFPDQIFRKKPDFPINDKGAYLSLLLIKGIRG